MNTNSLFNTIGQGFHIVIGAATELVETMQDPQKRRETLTNWQVELDQRTQEWAEKGEVTEKAARRVIDDLVTQQGKNGQGSYPAGSTSSVTTDTYTQLELGELTEQVIALRTQLEQLRNQL